jgi:hypothetical protein
MIITSQKKGCRFEDSLLTQNSAEINFQDLMGHAKERSFSNFTKCKSALLFHNNGLEELDSSGVRIRELSLICTGSFMQENKAAAT